MAYLVRACRPIRIFDFDEVLQGMWPISLGRVALVGVFDPDEIFQGLWPYRWGVSPLLGSLTLMKYFKACGLFGACRPIGILDPSEVLQGQRPVWGMSPYGDP